MLEPIISVERATLLVICALFCFFLGFIIFKNRKISRYPNLYAALVCFGTGLWILDSTFVDRVTIEDLYLFSGKLTYVIPYFSLFFFYIFFKKFPPNINNSSRYWTIASLIIIIILSFIALSPNDYAISIASNGQQLIPAKNLPMYYTLIAGFVFLIALIISEAISKWTRIAKTDKRTIKYILFGMVSAFIIAITFSIINALTISDSSFYQYAYPPILIFIALFAFVILKYGALDTSYTVSKKFITIFFISIIMLSSLLSSLYLYGLMISFRFSNTLSVKVGTILGLGIITYAIVDYFFNAKANKQITLSKLNSARSTQDFIDYIKTKYSLSRCHWQNKADQIKEVKPTLISKKMRQLADAFRGQSKILSYKIYLNNVDFNKRTIFKLKADQFSESGPNRTSLIIQTAYGKFSIGRKKYNMAFSNDELNHILHDIHQYLAQLEIKKIREDRANHVHQLEALTIAKKESLEKANQTLTIKLQRRAEFFRNIADELRTPLTVIYGLLQHQNLGLTQKTKNTLSESSRRLLALTKELKLVSQPNKVPSSEEKTDLRLLLNQLKRRYLDLLTNRKLKLNLKLIPANASTNVKFIHIEQILDNLIGNAIKYSPDQSSIDVELLAKKDSLKITVADQGIGINKQEQKLVFEPFYRTKRSKKIKGTGLGLSVVSRLAKNYQGIAKVESRGAGGSIFTVLLNTPGAS